MEINGSSLDETLMVSVLLSLYFTSSTYGLMILTRHMFSLQSSFFFGPYDQNKGEGREILEFSVYHTWFRLENEYCCYRTLSKYKWYDFV